MPEDDVSDLRDVFDAINKLCATMKTSYDEYEDCEDVSTELVDPNEDLIGKIHSQVAETWCDTEAGVSSPELSVAKVVRVETCMDSYTVIEPVVTTADIIVARPVPVKFETCKARLGDTVADPYVLAQAVNESISENVETYSESEIVIEPVTSTFEPIFEKVKTYKSERRDIIGSVVEAPDIEVARNIVTERFEEIEPIPSDAETVQCEPMSEMYYTASSEVSLLSDVDFQDRPQAEDSDDRNYNVMTGHVAAMRERFESMTRTNTPCPDLIRSASPSFEVFRNVSSSPDKLD